MIAGETVVVERRVESGRDPGNNPVMTWVPETVAGVLVSPGSAADLTGSIRPDGTTISWQLHFPKGYPETLRGARVKVRGDVARRVVGDPRHYTATNTPGRWSMPVMLEDADG